MYISTFRQWNDSVSEIDYLPSKEKNIWKLETKFNRWIVLNPNEKEYCNECTYLLGVQTYERSAKYSLTVE